MEWTSESGLKIDTYDEVMRVYLKKLNEQTGKSTTFEYFKSTDEYQILSIAAQEAINQQFGTAQIFDNVINYVFNNALEIGSPSTTISNVIPSIGDEFGFESAMKPMVEAERGLLHLAIDYTPSPELNMKIANFLVSNNVVAGVLTKGDIVQSVSITDKQEFEMRWTAAKPIDIKFKLELTVSNNRRYAIADKDEIKSIFLANYQRFYSMGKDIEPELYFEIERDAPYCSDIVTSWSVDGGTTWNATVLHSAFDSKYLVDLHVDNIYVT